MVLPKFNRNRNGGKRKKVLPLLATAMFIIGATTMYSTYYSADKTKAALAMEQEQPDVVSDPKSVKVEKPIAKESLRGSLAKEPVKSSAEESTSTEQASEDESPDVSSETSEDEPSEDSPSEEDSFEEKIPEANKNKLTLDEAEEAAAETFGSVEKNQEDKEEPTEEEHEPEAEKPGEPTEDAPKKPSEDTSNEQFDLIGQAVEREQETKTEAEEEEAKVEVKEQEIKRETKADPEMESCKSNPFLKDFKCDTAQIHNNLYICGTLPDDCHVVVAGDPQMFLDKCHVHLLTDHDVSPTDRLHPILANATDAPWLQDFDKLDLIYFAPTVEASFVRPVVDAMLSKDRLFYQIIVSTDTLTEEQLERLVVAGYMPINQENQVMLVRHSCPKTHVGIEMGGAAALTGVYPM